MTRRDIIEAFRAENTDLPTRVIEDAVLYEWLKWGDKEVCAITRCIQGQATFDSVATSSVYDTKYDLTTLITNFYDIDDNPGGGVIFDGDQLEKTTIAELDSLNSSWRSRSAGTPKKWYRRGNYLYFDRPVLTAGLDIIVYASLVSDDFDNDTQEPFNGLQYLRPYHNVLVKYLEWKGKPKIEKLQESATARQEFEAYCQFMKKQIGGNKFGKIYLQPKAGYAK